MPPFDCARLPFHRSAFDALTIVDRAVSIEHKHAVEILIFSAKEGIRSVDHGQQRLSHLERSAGYNVQRGLTLWLLGFVACGLQLTSFFILVCGRL
jgi:hypothetical protein